MSPVLARFAYGFVGFRVFQRLEGLFSQGISQGQLGLCRIQVFQGLDIFCPQGCLVLLTVVQGLGLFSVKRSFLVRVYLRVSYGCVGFRFFRVQISFVPRVAQVFLRLCRVQGFSALRGLFWLGYILGLVTVVQGLGFLGFRILLRLGLARFSYGWVGFRVFQRLEVFSGQGISQGQLRVCKVQVFLGFRVVLRLGFARFSYGWVGFRVFQLLEVFCGQGISQGQLRLCRVQTF